MPSRCCVPKCGNSSKNSIVHRFPLYDYDVFSIWVDRIANPKFNNLTKKEIHDNYGICHEHFTNDRKLEGSKKLKKYSLPTLLLPGFQGSPTDNFHVYRYNPTSTVNLENLLPVQSLLTIKPELVRIDHCYSKVNTNETPMDAKAPTSCSSLHSSVDLENVPSTSSEIPSIVNNSNRPTADKALSAGILLSFSNLNWLPTSTLSYVPHRDSYHTTIKIGTESYFHQCW